MKLALLALIGAAAAIHTPAQLRALRFRGGAEDDDDSLFGGDDPALLFFGLLIIFFQREPELPCADDLTGVDTPRQAAAAAALAIALLIVAPSPLLG